jgi:hypothetical protein
LDAPTAVMRPKVKAKPKADLTTILLVFAVLAVSLAITFLWLTMKRFDYQTQPNPGDIPHAAVTMMPGNAGGLWTAVGGQNIV